MQRDHFGDALSADPGQIGKRAGRILTSRMMRPVGSSSPLPQPWWLVRLAAQAASPSRRSAKPVPVMKESDYEHDQ